MERFKFDPVRLLATIVSIYLHFKSFDVPLSLPLVAHRHRHSHVYSYACSHNLPH
jgi:hypothetical protein